MKRLSFAFALILSLAAAGFGQTSFYYPHIANGLQSGANVRWKTTIFLTNPAASGIASGSVVMYEDTKNMNLSLTGSPFNSVIFRDDTGTQVNTGNTIAFQLGPGESRKYTSTGDGNYSGGFAFVSFTGSITGTALFSEFDATGTRLIGEAGVGASPTVPKQALFVDTIGNYDVGFAIANTGSLAAQITVSLWTTGGVRLDSVSRSLGPNNHFAQFAGIDLFPTAPKIAGTMQISSNVPVTAVALRFDPTYSIFTSLPPVTIASIFSEPLNAVQRLVASLFSHALLRT